jgi:hypothetical protein
MQNQTTFPAILCASVLVTACSPAAAPDFTGVWSGAFTTQKDEFWELEDLTACFPGCTPAARAYYAGLIEDPANDAQPVQALWGMATVFMREELAKKSTPAGLAIQAANNSANDPNFQCQPYGLVRAAVNPLPIAIRRDGDHLIIVYEEWNQSRLIFMDGRTHPADLEPTRLGHSVGRYESDALVIESRGIEPSLYYDFQSGGGHSDQATIVERYTIAENPRRLELTMTVTDPVTLLEPHVIEKTWLARPNLELVQDSCEDTPGKF